MNLDDALMAVQVQNEAEEALCLLRKVRTYLLVHGWKRGGGIFPTKANRRDGLTGPTCVMNAFNFTDNGISWGGRTYAVMTLQDVLVARGETWLVAEYNDQEVRTYSEIIYLLDDAIDSLEGELEQTP